MSNKTKMKDNKLEMLINSVGEREKTVKTYPSTSNYIISCGVNRENLRDGEVAFRTSASFDSRCLGLKIPILLSCTEI